MPDEDKMTINERRKGLLERYSLREIMNIMLNIVPMIFRDRRLRHLIRDTSGVVSRDLLGVVGYGVYAGRKG